MTEWLDRTRTVVYPIPTRASTLLAPAVGNLAPRPPPPCCKLLGAWSERLQGQGQVGTKTGARDVGARRVTVLYCTTGVWRRLGQPSIPPVRPPKEGRACGCVRLDENLETGELAGLVIKTSRPS
jgi:hypothetical protein